MSWSWDSHFYWYLHLENYYFIKIPIKVLSTILKLFTHNFSLSHPRSFDLLWLTSNNLSTEGCCAQQAERGQSCLNGVFLKMQQKGHSLNPCLWWWVSHLHQWKGPTAQQTRVTLVPCTPHNITFSKHWPEFRSFWFYFPILKPNFLHWTFYIKFSILKTWSSNEDLKS